MTNPFEDENGEDICTGQRRRPVLPVADVSGSSPGWKATDPRGERKVCLAWIDEHWTDMRPLSLVRQMEEDARKRQEQPDS